MITINNTKGNMNGGSLIKLNLLDKITRKYVLGHLWYFCLVMLRVLTETFQVYDVKMILGLFIEISLKREAERKEQRVKEKKKKKDIRFIIIKLSLAVILQHSASRIAKW